MSGCFNNFTAPAPVKALLGKQRRINLYRPQMPVPVTELFSKCFLVIRKHILKRLTLLKPEIFKLPGNIRGFRGGSTDFNQRICLFQFGGGSHMIVILVGQNQPGQLPRLNVMFTKFLLQQTQRTGISAINQHSIAAAEQYNRKRRCSVPPK